VTLDAINLFSGADGWGVGAKALGLDVVGIELDEAAAATATSAGHRTVVGSVTDYGPLDFPARGLIASPPCQTFSTAGKGAGRQALDVVEALARGMARGEGLPDVSAFSDPRTALVLEPLRWALQALDAGRPYEWIALEQVPTVLPVWELYAEILRNEGYSVAVGNLQAEQFGVPQTRRRAILVARLRGEARLPEPTHSRYHAHRPERLDEGVLPWVSIGEALGTDATLRSQYGSGGDPSARGLRTANEPAQTITGTADRAKWLQSQQKPATKNPQYQRRAVEAPSMALTGNSGRNRWDTGQQLTEAEAAVLQTFPADYPWQGTKGQRFLQIGNAVPPLMARAILAAATTPKEARA